MHMKLIGVMFAIIMLLTWGCEGVEYSASFKNVKLDEFVNTVSRNLNKTVVIDPSISNSRVSVRSYDMLNDEQYYQFFLSVLDVYGFAVVSMNNGLLKVVRSKDAKTSAIPVVDESEPGIGDEMVTRVISVLNISARELAPLLRQLNDNAGSGNVAYFEPSNALLLTGRAAVVNRLVEIVRRVDKTDSSSSEIIPLHYASAVELVKLLSSFNRSSQHQNGDAIIDKSTRLVADERTNSVVISGEMEKRTDLIKLIHQLDRKLLNNGSSRIFYLKYAKAKEIIEVLKAIDVSADSSNKKNLGDKLAIAADDATNSLLVKAQPDVMAELEQILIKLDIRRAQVLVEAIIVEIADGDGLNLGIQWGNPTIGGTQFTNTGLPISSLISGEEDTNPIKNFDGMAAGFYHGDWAVLATALASNSKSDILSTPSIVTMDNKEATFKAGQEVPVQTGTQSSVSSDEVFNTIERKTVGTKLTVTPQINEKNSILLSIEQEVSSVAQTQAPGTSNLGPTFDTRTVTNTVLVKSGETVVLGGLMDEKTNEVVSKVPILGDIPYIGLLFRSTTNSISKRNLMVFIRPTILLDANVYADVSNEKYKSLRAVQLEASKREKYATSPERQILPQNNPDTIGLADQQLFLAPNDSKENNIRLDDELFIKCIKQ